MGRRTSTRNYSGNGYSNEELPERGPGVIVKK